jgi:hypothetical protein
MGQETPLPPLCPGDRARLFPLTAWLKAANAVNAASGHEAHNVIVDVAEPLSESAPDRRVVQLVDAFLRSNELMPVQAVANTIFPHEEFEGNKPAELHILTPPPSFSTMR